jgi:hypothetical protein
MFELPTFAPVGAFIAYWALVGICPDNWPFNWPPRRRPPRVPPGVRGPLGPGPMPPPWARVLGAAAGVAGGFVFTGVAGAGLVSSAPILDFAATGVFALAGAVGARALAAQFSPEPEVSMEVEGAAAFRP